MIIGVVTGFRGPFLCGWASSSDPSATNCLIEVRDDDGRLLRRGRTASHLVDRGNVGFRLPIGYPSCDRVTSIRVFADGTEISGSPVAIGPGCYDGEIWLDTNATVCGWVSERRSPTEPPYIEIRPIRESDRSCAIRVSRGRR